MGITEERLSLDDVLLVPQKLTFSSRFNGDINLSMQLLPGHTSMKYPIISANMDTVTESKMADKMGELGGLGIIHRFMPINNHKAELEKLGFCPRILCIGVGNDGIERFTEICEKGHEDFISAILIDVAHGHSNAVIDRIKEVKKAKPELPVMAGNVATYSGTYDLLEAGADCVKVGVGPGCFTAGTRILMSNGMYKNIEDVKPNDEIISGDGTPTVVVGVQHTGLREVVKVRHSYNGLGTFCTPDHRYWCGDLNTISPVTLSSRGYAYHLDKLAKTTPKQSKYKWKQIGNFQQDVGLLPKNIEFDMPKYFDIKIPYKHGPIRLTPSRELGYLIGFFLGDGNASCTLNKKNGSHSGHITFYPSLEEEHLGKKLENICWEMFGKKLTWKESKGCFNLKLYLKPLADLLDTFGKAENKHLPVEFLVNDRQYLMGLFEGLQDSDGIASDRQGFSNTSQRLTELYFVLRYILTGTFPTLEHKPPTTGGLNCNLENCKPSHLTRICPTFLKRQTENYQVAKILEITETNLIVPVYDIEVEHPEHSFIADNAIVHNSLCTTRIKTGCGVPQLTAIMDAKRAVKEWFVQKYGNKSREDAWEPTLIADGGIKSSGDVVKSLAAGANAVMIGALFAGTDETPGRVVNFPGKGKMKEYRGMASREAQESWKGRASSIEGEMTFKAYKGSLKDVFDDLISGVLSGMSYQNAKNIRELQNHADFRKITSAGWKESLPHGTF